MEPPERLDEGSTADPQAKGAAGGGQQGCEQFVSLGAVVGAGGLQQRDGLGHGAALLSRRALQDAVEK